MRDCNECEHFGGWDWDDGTPCCSADGGYENCPFNDYAPTNKNNTKIEIDVEYFTEYIRHTLKNTFHDTAESIASIEIKNIVESEYTELIQRVTKEYVTKCVQEQVDEFMQGEIKVGGGWDEPIRTITRQKYISELVEKNLNELSKHAVDFAKKAAQEVIDDFTRNAKKEINVNMKKNFDETMRKALTDNVVELLMANETFARLSASMDRLLK